MHLKNIHPLVILGFCLFCVSAQSAQLAVGDAVPVISANDQHGGKFVFTNGIQFLLAVTEMAPAKSANRALAAEGSSFLETNHAAFLMDIHTMPGIARYFAFPKLKKYPQRIVLVDSADTLAGFPMQPGRVTLLALTSNGHIKKISYWNPESEAVAGLLR
jgi:hypothetical protein